MQSIMHQEVAIVQRWGTYRLKVSYGEVYEWIEALRVEVEGNSGGFLVVGIELTPFSIEETAAMVMVAQQEKWSYVPVDCALSITRQVSIVKTAKIQRLVTMPDSPLAKMLMMQKAVKTRTVELATSPFRSVQVLQFSADYFQSEEDQCVGTSQDKDAEVPLYILFTSGTTGDPRGVLGTRVGAWTRLEWMWNAYPFVATERVLRATKLSFVDSVWEILGAFLNGVPLVHLQRPRKDRNDASDVLMKSVVLDDSAKFLAVLKSEQVTRFTAVPSVLEVLLLQTTKTDRQSALAELRYVLSSGEPLPLHVLQKLTTDLPEITILNLYGSTEVSGDVTCMELRAPFSTVQMTEWQHCGVPIAKLNHRGVVGSETSLMLLRHGLEEKATHSNDHALNTIWPSRESTSDTNTGPCTGLLYLSGPLVARGYAGRDSVDMLVTSGKALGVPKHCKSNESAHSKRWFCTGDICSVVRGHLYFCGRKDNAVKIHGQRVYLEAVERAVATALNETEKYQIDGNVGTFASKNVIAFTFTNEVSKYALPQQCIVACIICDGVDSIAIDRYPKSKEMNVWITERYGSSHCPHEVYTVPANAVKRLNHGKMDRRALKDILTRSKVAGTNTAVTNNKEVNGRAGKVIAQLLNEICGLPTSEGISDDIQSQTFSEAGGTSLLATLFVHELRQKLGKVSVTNQELLHMTIGALLSKLSSTPDKRVHEGSRTKILSGTRASVDAIDRNYDTQPGSDLKRRKKICESRADRPSDNEADAYGETNHRNGLHFISRYNQSSMSMKGIFIPSCYVSSLPPVQQTVLTPSPPWELRNAWRVDLEKCIDASPLVVRFNSTNCGCSTWVIVGSHSAQLVCIDVQDAGKEIWRVKLDDRIEACAALSVNYEIAYVGTYAGTLFALDLHSGETRWRFHTTGTIKSSALVIDKFHLVVCGSYDNKLYGLDAETGKQKWALDLQGSIFSTPYYCAWSNQLFAASTYGVVVAAKLDAEASGSIIEQWKLKLPAPVFAGLSVDYISKMLIVGSADGQLYGVDTTTGVTKWQLTTKKPIFSSPCIYHPGSTVFGSHDGMLRKVDCQSGKLVWATNLHGAVFASPTVVRFFGTPVNHQLGSGRDGSAQSSGLVCCVTTTTGQLYFCDEETGSIIYQTNNFSGKTILGASSCDNDGDLGPLFASPVLVDNWCLLATRTNYFFGFELTTTIQK